METTFKKLLYAGIGLANEASEKIEKKVNELAKKGETTDSEVKKIVDDFIKKTDETTASAEKKFNEIIEKFGYAKNTEVTELRKKLETLEAMAAEKTKTATVKTSK
jgi:polyhydroxyalkanoate synthesis regulator phasin